VQLEVISSSAKMGEVFEVKECLGFSEKSCHKLLRHFSDRCFKTFETSRIVLNFTIDHLIATSTTLFTNHFSPPWQQRQMISKQKETLLTCVLSTEISSLLIRILADL
jgi:hypothetical protein